MRIKEIKKDKVLNLSPDCDCAGAEPKPKAVFTQIRQLLLKK